MTTFFTGKGDDGTTRDFSCKARESKAGRLFETLGALDELNSVIGLCRARVCTDTECQRGRPQGGREHTWCHETRVLLLTIQQNLFTIQAELAGSDKRLGENKVHELEMQIADLGKDLPEIRTFLIPGESELGALFDLARTVARRAERELVRLKEEESERACPPDELRARVGTPALAYINRLSSILYVLARREASKCGKVEKSPNYS